MKKSTQLFKIAAVMAAIFFSGFAKSQCSASFIWSQWAGGVIGYTSTSAPVNSLTTYYWSFGNGATYTAMGSSGIGTSQTYTANGTYTVTLFIMGVAPTCSSQVTQTITVTNALPPSGCPLVAGCSNFLGGPGQMNFTNNSSGTTTATSYTWNYGNGATSFGLNGTQTYSANGVYTVTLFASNNSTCTSTYTLQVTITTVCNLNASFNISQGTNGLVNFVSTSTGTASGYVYQWNFGNGNNGSGASTAHTYANGTYTVTLTVKNTSVAATCTSSAVQTIAVTSNTCFLQSAFTATVGSGGLVNFSNTSLNTNSNTTYLWNFGNGNISSTSGNPFMTYLNGGIHTVKLTITNSASPTCSSVAIQTINVNSIPCNANANFTLTYANSPGYWNATPSYPWNVVGAQWNWGDGSISNGLFTSHTYSVSGNYNICLSVTVSCAATASACTTYSIYRSEAATIYQVNAIEPILKNIDDNNTVGISENRASSMEVNLYPNPTNREFYLTAQGLNNDVTRVIITDLVGREIISIDQNSASGEIREMIDLGKEHSGIYFVTLISGNQSLTKKIIISK